MKPSRLFFIAAMSIAGAAAHAEDKAPPSFADALRAHRFSLALGPGGLTGDGAAVVTSAVAQSRIVALGEDHLTVEVPAFASALCDVMAPMGLAATVVEAGPVATAAVADTFKAADGPARMAAFDARYLNGVAFLDTAADYAFASHCAAVSKDPNYSTIGIDQEFVGSAGLLLDRILATKLTPDARRETEALRADEASRSKAAAVTGDPSGVLLMAISDDRIAREKAALERGGNPEARALFEALRISHEIYAKNASGASDSNLERALLMKRTFNAAAPMHGHILMKFGDWHLYKGVNPLGERDIGNFVAEQSDVAGAPSIHIAMLGARGTHALFNGYAKPLKFEPFVLVDDPDYGWFKTAVDAQLGHDWTLFDLRPLRHHKLDGVTPDWRRMIDGYDLLVVVPELHPSDLVGARPR